MTSTSSPLLRRTVRVAVPAVAALTLTMAFAGPAAADPSFVSRAGGVVSFAALPGETNTVTFLNLGSVFRVTDTTANLTAGPGCTQVDIHTVNCGSSTNVTRIQAALGNQNDIAENKTNAPADIDGGAGEDQLTGGGGNDRLTDPDGWNGPTLITTTFDGGGGNDTIVSRNGGFDRIACGAGFDIVVADNASLDFLATSHSCDFVIR
ncbi:hypothetical protein ACFWBN_04515 [Streptomyces sp. NPDC059989]|uniref:hypothetical protein n=1 Tax=Streptomyces sp. NPDC059989 TaxID=3347026 RepID=UPI0036799FFA